MSATVKRKDPKAVERVYSRLGQTAGREVAVGFPRGKVQAYPESGQGVAEVAARHVYGVGVPERNFMGQAQAGIVQETRSLMRAAARAGQGGDEEGSRALLEAAGAKAANEIKLAIRDGDFEPLSERTIERRAEEGRPSTKPLIDTAHMITHVTWAVRKRGG